jgi:predicted DNA-binding protein
MLGIRLKPDEEDRLDRHAKALGRPKSVLVREWINERLERDSIDSRIASAARVIAEHERASDRSVTINASAAYLRRLDELDGGYDWGPKGPPK